MEDEDDSTTSTAKEPEVIAFEKERQKGTDDNLSMYIWAPPSKRVERFAAFDHMVAMRQHKYADKQKDHKISDYLHIHSPIKGYTDSARNLFKIEHHNVLESNVLKSVGNGGNKLEEASSSSSIIRWHWTSAEDCEKEEKRWGGMHTTAPISAGCIYVQEQKACI